MLRYRLRTLFLLVFLAAVATILACCIEAVWGGRFLLTVHVADADVAELTELKQLTLFRLQDATQVASNPQADASSFDPVPFQNGAFVVSVPCGGRSNWIRGEVLYTEMRYLVLWGHFKDGTEHCQVFELPIQRGDRSMVVMFNREQDSPAVDE